MNPHTPPPPPPEPLDDEERELARALRGLPSSMPPPELDARILGASRRAIAITPKPRGQHQRWVWGLSTAAAAVLAAGVLLKMHSEGRDQAAESAPATPAAAQRAVAEPSQSPAAGGNTVSADMERAPSDNGGAAGLKAKQEQVVGAPAPSDMAAARSVGAMQESAPQERDELQSAKAAGAPTGLGAAGALDKSAAGQAAASNAAPQPFPMTSSPPPPPPQQVVSPVRQREAKPVPPPPQPPVVTATPAFSPSPVSTPAPAAPATASDRLRPPPEQLAQPLPADQFQKSGIAADARKDAALERTEVTGSRVKRANESALLPSVDDDAKLPPGQWIERIRARVNAADGVSARESMRRLLARYPNAEIPADLAPLR